MIVESMSHSEIVDEYKKDYSNGISSYLIKTHKQNEAKWRRLMVKSTDQRRTLSRLTFKSAIGNEYIIHFFSIGKRDYLKDGSIFTILLKYRTRYGIHIMMPDLVNDAYQFYTSHMFDRYRDRFLLDGNLNKTDVINRFFENNNLTNLRTYNAPKYPESLFAQTSDGVLCGDDLSPNIVEYKTFITTEMLYDEQLEISEELLIGLNNAERR